MDEGRINIKKIVPLYCLNCGEEQETYITTGDRYCIVCLGTEFASCPPPEMTEEHWKQIFEMEGADNGKTTA